MYNMCLLVSLRSISTSFRIIKFTKMWHWMLFIQKSKTDIYRDGNRIIIARTGNNLCSVKNLEFYLQWVGNDHKLDFYLFRILTKYNDHYIFRKENVPLCYTRMREPFIQAFKPFVSDIKSYGLHSLRSGGATVACNFGVPDRLFKRHGRWRSENAKDGYVKDSFNDLLFVSKNLGI